MELRKLLLIAFIFSGIAALIYELTWIRPLQFLLGSTTYTISIILAAFMFGLALGSWFITKHVDEIKNLPKAYGLMELGIGLYGVLLLSIFNFLPKVYNSLYWLHGNFYVFTFVQFVLIFAVLLIPTTLMGATFPVIAKFYTQEKIGKGIGEIYSANNLGAIIGSFGAGFILIPVLGIKYSIIFAGVINLIVGLGIILAVDKKSLKNTALIAILIFAILVLVGNYNIQKMHSGGFYRTDPNTGTLGDVVYYDEGLYATVTVRELTKDPTKESIKSLFINGYGQGGATILDLRVNFLLAYLPLLINPKTENALVIGLGTGTTSGQLAQLTKTTTIEIEPKIVEASDHFKLFNANVLENPNHKLIIDDGRNYLLKNKEKYNLIALESTNSWQSFSTQLYSREFFELIKEDLDDDGLFVKWVPIYLMSPEDFKNFYKTFSSVFPYNAAFANIKPDEDTPARFDTSEIILIGSKKELEIDKDKFIQNYNALPEQSKKYLDAIRLGSGDEIYHLLLFTSQDMRGYADDAEFVTDDNLILEFSAAKNVLNQKPKEVIDAINAFIEKNVVK